VADNVDPYVLGGGFLKPSTISVMVQASTTNLMEISTKSLQDVATIRGKRALCKYWGYVLILSLMY
jgi:hypothetical protein